MIQLFYGLPGAGKTTAMMDYVHAHADKHRFFVTDRAAEWGAVDPDNAEKPNPRWRGLDPKLIRTILPDEVPDEWPETGIFLFQYPWEGLDVAQLAVDVGNVVVCDDEMDLVAVRTGWETSPLRMAVHRGRHAPNAKGEICELHIMGAARRPQNLHIDLTSMADQVFIFRVQGHRTLERLQLDSMISDADDEEWMKISSLPNFEYKLWKNDGTSSWGTVKNPFSK